MRDIRRQEMDDKTEKGADYADPPPALNRVEEVRALLLQIKDYPFESQIVAICRFIGTEREDAAAKITQRFPWLGGDK